MTGRQMKLAAGAVQFDVLAGNRAANIKRAFSGIRRLGDRGVKLAALPEMWSCGFDYENLAEHAKATPEILEELMEKACEFNMTVVGSLPENTGGGTANTAFAVDSKGIRRPAYRKVHLFSPTREDRHFEAGDRAVVVETDAGKIGLLICYDLRFPELARKTAEMGAEILVIPAQWPIARARHWDVLLTARAIENQLFVVAANRCGHDRGTVFAGHSAITSPWGVTLARAGTRPAAIMAELDLDEIAFFREKIPCWKDRKPLAYER